MNTATLDKAKWSTAYRSFLLSKDESLLLKLAPLIMLLGAPEVLISNLIPGVGEVLDLGGFSISLLLLFRTYMAVRKYR